MLVWLEYPIHSIDNLIQTIMWFHYVTGLDLNMGCLFMSFNETSKVILTITIPCGLFACQILPKGVKPATDIFQG